MTLLDKTVTISLEKPIYGGYCIGRCTGKAILVPYGIPGETIAATIYDEKKDYCFASIENIQEEDAGRIAPECPHFGQCGGCSYLHVPYDRELDFKKTILRDNLTRTAGLAAKDMPDIKVISSGRLHYRSHATLKAENGCPGFYRKGTNVIVSIRETGCLLIAEELNSWLHKNEPLPDNCRIAVDSAGQVIASFHHDPVVIDHAGGFVFSRGISQFFQSNRFLRDRMLEIVRNSAGIRNNEEFLDIGCGVGFFSIALAGLSGSGTGIDISGVNIRRAKKNACLNGITNVRFQALASSQMHPGRMHPDVAVVDPPRAGIDKKTRKTILAMKPSRLVYVSCNPATFSRDVRDFIAGGYFLEKLYLFDMFPCTHHIEIISRFTLR